MRGLLSTHTHTMHPLVLGFVVPIVFFVFAGLVVHVAFPWVMAFFGARLGATVAHPLTLKGRLVLEMCLARSATMLLVGAPLLVFAIPASVSILLGLSSDAAFLLRLVGCWMTVVLAHELSTYLLLGLNPEWGSNTLFVLGCALGIMSFGVALGFLAIIAAGDIARGVDYANYALRTAFAGDTPRWISFQRRVETYEHTMDYVIRGQKLAVFGLLTHATWTNQLDPATIFICIGLYVLHMMPKRALYFRAPPPVGTHAMILGGNSILYVEDERDERDERDEPPDESLGSDDEASML